MGPGELWAEVEGDIGKVERTIKITAIRVTYKFSAPREKREVVERLLQVHPAGCPAHQSVKDAIPIDIKMDVTWT